MAAAGRNNSAERKAITAAKWLYSGAIPVRVSLPGRRLNKRTDAIVNVERRRDERKRRERTREKQKRHKNGADVGLLVASLSGERNGTGRYW